MLRKIWLFGEKYERSTIEKKETKMWVVENKKEALALSRSCCELWKIRKKQQCELWKLIRKKLLMSVGTIYKEAFQFIKKLLLSVGTQDCVTGSQNTTNNT